MEFIFFFKGGNPFPAEETFRSPGGIREMEERSARSFRLLRYSSEVFLSLEEFLRGPRITLQTTISHERQTWSRGVKKGGGRWGQ